MFIFDYEISRIQIYDSFRIKLQFLKKIFLEEFKLFVVELKEEPTKIRLV